MKSSMWLLAAGIALAACSDRDGLTRRTQGGEPERMAAVEQAPSADDTARNARDRSGETLTPVDQSNAEVDLEITRRIRDALTSSDSLSVSAQNAKVITRDGMVTLRGPVESEEERSAIASIAQGTPGVRGVDDQLEIDRDSAVRE
jgi:osmotically-inducible protein OsmY